MKPNIIAFLLTLLLISCHQKNEKISTAKTEIPKTDSIEKIDIDKTLFSVYELSKTTTAIVANLQEKNTYEGAKFDKIFDQVNAKDSLYNVLERDSAKVKNFEYYDTLGPYKLIKNKTLEKEVKKIIEKSYYVYGTKGFSKVTINNVIMGLDECRTNFIAFPIEDFDTAKNGKPIFCSKQLLNINYHKSYSDIQKKVRAFYDKESTSYDYTDEIKPTVFANIGNAYFIYRDDFIWGKDLEKSKCKFPARTIYIVNKDNPVKKFWVDGLDLFGIPCD
ncbi:MAG: hypothetical protein EOO44_00200 [Flavobacterium sp.]|nr:MAG: hypothetical protein EOO44_00200 [Flavobacterium sp.]